MVGINKTDWEKVTMSVYEKPLEAATPNGREQLMEQSRTLHQNITGNLQLLHDALANTEILLRLQNNGQTLMSGPSVICSLLGWDKVVTKLLADSEQQAKVMNNLGQECLMTEINLKVSQAAVEATKTAEAAAEAHAKIIKQLTPSGRKLLLELDSEQHQDCVQLHIATGLSKSGITRTLRHLSRPRGNPDNILVCSTKPGKSTPTEWWLSSHGAAVQKQLAAT
jgi:hypothetical protein